MYVVFWLVAGVREKRVDNAKKFDEMLNGDVRLRLYLVQVDAIISDPCNKNGGGFGPIYNEITTLVTVLVIGGDRRDQSILSHAVKILTLAIASRVQLLHLTVEDGKDFFPIIMIGGIIDANKKWDKGREVTISKDYFLIIIISVVVDANRKWDRGREVTNFTEDAFGEMGALNTMENGSTSLAIVFNLLCP